MTLTRTSLTTSPSMSFYVSPDPALIVECSRFADAVTVRGASGPGVVGKLRRHDFTRPVLFDREDWKRPVEERTDTDAWIAEQEAASADRVLTPGRTVFWDKNDPTAQLDAVADELADARAHDATALLNVDVRHLTRNFDSFARALCDGGGDVALILADPSDPLKSPDAVDALRALAQGIARLKILRVDHGGIGAVAFGADHAAIGLRPTNRHGSIPGRPAFGKPGDTTARVFSVPFADWFTAGTIAGWSLADPTFMLCKLPCCGGQSLLRFLDEDQAREAVQHNIRALAKVADQVLNAPTESMRQQEFLDYCRAAAARYDLAGFHGPQNPKAQLTAWVLS